MATKRGSPPPAPPARQPRSKGPAPAAEAPLAVALPGPFDDLSREELIELLAADDGGRIRISFVGKANARRIARKVRPRVLRPVKALSAGSPEEQARNQLIEGDNLQAMATLYRERSQVDLILTDPPYNTGGDWRYNDRWDEDPNDPGLGEVVTKDEVGRHTKWMQFMWPRLQMMKAMLKPGGVLAICIDHRELFRLGQMLDELFGQQNRLAILNWQKMTAPKSHDTAVSTATEYVLVYARDAEQAKTGRLAHSDVAAGAYQNRDGDVDRWCPADSTLMGGPTHPGQVYGIQNPFTGRVHYPQEGRCWRNERAKMKAAVEDWGVSYEDRDLGDGLNPALVLTGVKNPLAPDPRRDPVLKAAAATVTKRREAGRWPRFFWRDDQRRQPGHGELRYKTYYSEVKAGVVPTTFWASDDFELLRIDAVSWPHAMSGTTDIGVKELNAVVGRGHRFDTVKPMALFQKIITLWSPTDGLVLDPFAGSGTTGHAVLALNAATGSTRRFALIEQGRPARGDPYASSLTADRLKRAVSGAWSQGQVEPLGGGYTFQRLGKRVDAQALLQMEREEMVDTVIASHFDATRRRGSGLIPADGRWRYLVAKSTDGEGFFLVWDGPDANTDLTRTVYGDIAREAKSAGLKAPYHVYARLHRYQTGTVRFYQIPDRILADFGLDLRDEPFASLDE